MVIKKPHVLILFFVGVLLIVGTVLYLKKYESIRREAVLHSDKHCIALNSLIKNRSFAFIDSMNVAATGSAEQFQSYQDQYYNITKEYVKLEKLWLSQDEAFLNRSDVKFFLPTSIQEGMKLKQQMFRDEYENARRILKKYRREPDFHLRVLTPDIVESSTSLRIAHQGYLMKFGQQPKKDFRDSWVRIPESQCPENNAVFPDIEQELGGLVIGP